MPASFTVYCDVVVDAPTTPLVTPALSLNSARLHPVLATFWAKENIHPVTGERCVAIALAHCPATAANRKRKAVVLATQSIDQSGIKRRKQSGDGGDRIDTSTVVSSTQTNRAPSSLSAIKNAATTGTRCGKPSSHHAPMPKLVEQSLEIHTTQRRVRKLRSSLKEKRVTDGTSEKAKAVGAQPSTDTDTSLAEDEDLGLDIYAMFSGITEKESAVFSQGEHGRTIPERQYIHSAFTFSSPSPVARSLDSHTTLSSPNSTRALPRLDFCYGNETARSNL